MDDISGGGTENVVQLNQLCGTKAAGMLLIIKKLKARKKHEETVSPVKTGRMKSGAASTTQALPTPSTSQHSQSLLL